MTRRTSRRSKVDLDSQGIQEIDVRTWSEFEDQLKTAQRLLEREQSLLFRAQSDSSWPLETTLERYGRPHMLFSEYYRVVLKVRPQIEAFTGNRWVIPTYPSVEEWTKEYDTFSMRLTSGRLPGYEFLAYLRHHGFPSPLLDWTRSPHVAAYFAFRNAATSAEQQTSIYVFAEPQFRGLSNRKPSIFRQGPFVRTHRRHFLQQSEYTLCIGFDDGWRFEPYTKLFESADHHQGKCWKFNIPLSERVKVLRILDAYNLNSFSLLTSEESLMETMAIREFHIQNAGHGPSHFPC
jgi:hypothetical protein